MLQEVLWAGISFGDDGSEDVGHRRSFGYALFIGRQHDAVVSRVTNWKVFEGVAPATTEYPSGAALDEYRLPDGTTFIDLYDALGTRIGFGRRVSSVDEGRACVAAITSLFKPLGITLPVSVWAWSPASVPTRTVQAAERETVHA